MKAFYKILMFTALIQVFTSCDGYLDLVPDNVATVESAFTNRAAAEKFLYTCYSYRPQWGDLFNDPAINGGDETWQFYPIASHVFPTFTSSYLQRGFQKLDDPYLNFWDGLQGGKGLFIGIRDCNIFLENIASTVDLEESERIRWVAEVKFLKAYYHYYLLKCYGPIPIIDENLPVSASPEQVAVYRDKVDDVVTYVNDLILEALPDLPDYKDMVMSIEGGRVDKQIALTVRAEMLVMAASPLFNGNTEMAGLIDNRGTVLFNQTYDPEKWKIAADACKEAIEACHGAGKKLYTEIEPITVTQHPVFQLQTMLRQVVCERWNCELIWGGTNSQCRDRSYHSTPRVVRIDAGIINTISAQWAPTIKTVERFYTSNGVPMNEDKQWSREGWYDKRYELRSEPSSGDEKYFVKEGQRTCYMHYNREPRFYASIGFDQGIYYGNGKNDFESCNYTNFLNLGWSGYQGGSSYSITGYAPKKMASYKNGVTNSTIAEPEYYPFPVIRLADLYLLYAEALNEYSGPSAEVYEYIDRIRERAGLEGVIDSWSKYSTDPSKPTTKEGLRNIIHDERTVEFAFESKRYWDIRRWKQIDTYNIQPQGWNIMGETPEDFYKLQNVAEVPVKVTVKDYFMPIRETNIITNKNLVQNYGW